MARRALFVLAGLVAAWLVLCLVLFVWSPWESSAPRHASVVVVLSGDKRRLAPALALFRRGVASTLAISSVGKTRHWSEARRLCKEAHVLCFAAVPYSTKGEARTIARLARRRGWTSVIVVTSTFHVTRARMLFRRCFKRPLYVLGTGSTWWRLPEEWGAETAKLAVQLTFERGC